MIFVTVGNWATGFDRLVRALDEMKGASVVLEDVFAQIGDGKYTPVHLRHTRFCSPAEFERHMDEAQVIISHAGMGTISRAIVTGKAIIVVPRRASLGEHLDDHQVTTARTLEKEGKVLVAYEVHDLPEKLRQAETFVPVHNSSGDRIVSLVGDFLDALAARKKGRTE